MTDAVAAPSEGRRWYVAQSQPRKERYAEGHLRNQGYEVFLPQVARIVRHARRTQRTLRPLFPRYLFVSLDRSVERWRPIRSTFGVSAVIMEGEGPKPVPVGVVEALIRAADGDGGYDFGSRLRLGEDVRFLAGAFADRIGTLVELDDDGRVGVLMEILGARRVLATRRDNLLPAAG